MVHKLKTIRGDMLVLQCQLERELIRYVRRYLCQPQVTIITNDKQHGVVIRSLNDKKTDLKKEGKSTDAVDDLIIKIGHAPRRKFKVVEKESCRESR